jgi:hypothetical protein
MTKDLGCKWNFVDRRRNSMGQSREDSSFAPFVSHKIRCLVREYIQNSMDAHTKWQPEGPVIVTFSFGELICSEYPSLILSLLERLKACSEYNKLYPNSKDPYESKFDYLNSHKDSTIGFLRVGDYNTTGMPYIDDEDLPSAFEACVRKSSASYKDDDDAGGSHGQGKTVGFVNSELNAVYYSTRTEDGQTFGEGVIKLSDHKLVDESGKTTHYEAIAFFDSEDGNRPNVGDAIPEVFRRELPGTDVFVIGFDRSEEDILAMKKETLRSFFKAIYENRLAVEIEGELFSADNLVEKMDTYFPVEEVTDLDYIRTNSPELEFNPRPYLLEALMSQLSDEDHIVIDSNEAFPDRFKNLGHAKLYMWKSQRIKSEGSRDSVVYMRNNSMAIEVKRGRNNNGYYGIFVCDGKGSKYLRIMENVTHDKWDEDELRNVKKETKTLAIKTRREVGEFITACEELVFPKEQDTEKEILSLKKHRLGTSSSKADDKSEELLWPTTNIIRDVREKGKGSSSVTILETRRGGKKKKKDTGAVVPPVVIPVPDFPKLSDRDHIIPPGPDPEPKPDKPDKPKLPTVGGEGDTSGESQVDSEKGKHMTEIKLDGRNRRLIPLHDGEFACKLVIRVPQDYESCRLVLSVQGVSGQVPLELRRVSSGCRISGSDNNEIVGVDLHKDIVNEVRFTPVESLKNYTLIIKAYGN